MDVICLQHLLIEYLEKYIFLKIADVKSIIQLSCWHFFADVKQFELERLLIAIMSKTFLVDSTDLEGHQNFY